LDLVVRISESEHQHRWNTTGTSLGIEQMIKARLFLCAAIATGLFCSDESHAQLSGQVGGQTNGENGTGGLGTNGLDPNDAFSDLQRGTDVGSTGNTGRGFSESSVSAPNAAGGAVTPGGVGGGLGGFGGVGGFGGLFDSMNSDSSQNSKPLIRTRMRSAVRVQARAPAQVGRIATGRFRSLTSRPQLRGVSVTMQGRTAIIHGSVRNESDRRMSQLLIRLEPGVSRIDNRVVVQP